MIPSFSFRTLLTIILAITTQLDFAQIQSIKNNAAYTVTKKLLSIEDGLASHEVFCGLQDESGFMWFGTRNGLNRYDGKNCLLFTRQRNNLQDNKVVQVARDDANNLFIEYGSAGFQLTTNGKVDVMNATTQKVRSLGAAFPGLPFKENDVYWISGDGTGDVNFLTANPFRLWRYNSRKGFTLHLEMKEWNNEDLHSADYRSTGPLCMFGKGQALLKIFNQATQYLVTKNKVIQFRQPNALRSLPIGFTSDNELLLTYNTTVSPNAFNVAKIMADGMADTSIDLQKYHLRDVKDKYWYQLASAADNTASMFYIGSDAIYLWNENAFLQVLTKTELKSFENLFLYRLFPDNFGNLWLCTSTGVLHFKIEKNRFTQYFTNAQQSVQPNSQARGIYADESGNVLANIWTHTFIRQGEKTKYVFDEEIKYALARHHSELYCGGYNLFHYDEATNKLLKSDKVPGTEIWSMFSLNDSLLLLGRTNGFSLFNSTTHLFDSINYSNNNIPEAKFVYRFFKDRADTIWAVAENGLYKILSNKYSRSSAAPSQYAVFNTVSRFINSLNLLDAYADEQDIFWFATNGEGLYRWNKKANTFRQFTITSGLPSDVLYRLEPDDNGNLWISSDNGLIRFNRKTFAINTYSTVDGISHNEFNRTSSFRAKDGRLFFGGLDGVNAFNPEDFITDTNALNVPLRVIAFNQYVASQNRLVNKTTTLLDASEITLEPGDKFFTLEFQLLDFEKDDAHRYAYLIEGQDKEWNYINENSIRISGLSYGNLTLRIKAQNHEGAWSRSELKIPISILKPFYLQWWFIALMTLLLLLVVYLVIYFRIKQLAVDKKRLEQTVNDRTAQLKNSISKQSVLLLEKDLLMKEIHHRVKNNLQVISGLLELQSKKLGDETARNALREGRNRVRSIALIHQNLYQFEDISTIELSRFVTDLCKQVKNVFEKQHNIEIDIQVPSLYLDIDSAVPLGLIMNELLSNSFKYAFEDSAAGIIKLEIRSVAEGKYELKYSDNGQGLPVDFDLRKADTLGIQLINDLSRQIGGNVKYEYNNGALFTINFTNRDLRKKED